MKAEFVDFLPDLISPESYAADREGRRVCIRIRVTDSGIEILGDSPTPRSLESLLEELGAETVQQMLCG